MLRSVLARALLVLLLTTACSIPLQRKVAADPSVVVLVHGLANWPVHMSYLETALEKNGFQVLNLGYPSTDVSIEEAAGLLREKVLRIEAGTRVNFVAHSLGNIVVRKMLEEDLPYALGRMVMIAPPNQGSFRAQQLRDLGLYRWFFGPAGQELSRDNEEFFRDLPPPPMEFGVIAGGRGVEGYSSKLPGDDDGTVSVQSTRLEGMADFIVLQDSHTLILFDRDTAEQTLHFLNHGRFQHDSEQTKTVSEGP